MGMNVQIGDYRRRTNCRVCGGGDLSLVLDYGNMPLAGGFLLKRDLGDQFVYPMDLVVCERCSLVQIPNVVAPDILFTDYRYLSSVTNTLRTHFECYAKLLKDKLRWESQPLVVEIGCNDGVLLGPLQEMGVKVVGVDAAENVAEITRSKGIRVLNAYFDERVATQIREEVGQANIITASNVFAHIDNLDQVMSGVDKLLATDGTFIVEVHYIMDLLKDFQFDTVYHEHLCYYSAHALQTLYSRFGFTITDIQRLSMHGGSIRVFANRSNCKETLIHQRVDAIFAEEREFGINNIDVYERFGQKVKEYCEELIAFVRRRKQLGHSISAYGAAGRATILLNYCALDNTVLDYIVDESSFRIGRYVPGVNLPIVPRIALRERPTNDCLLTAWNYREEILKKEQFFLKKGGEFLVPLPKLEVVTI